MTTLTNDIQIDRVADGRGGTDLTLVDTGVFLLRVADPEAPVFCVRGVDRFKPLVAGVRVPAYSKQVDVPVSHPGYLEPVIRWSQFQSGQTFEISSLYLSHVWLSHYSKRLDRFS